MSSFLPVEPFREWLHSVYKISYTNKQMKEELGMNEQSRLDIMGGKQKKVSLRMVDTILTRAGVMLESVYPYDEYPT